MSEKKVLEMKGITKIYPGVRALDGVACNVGNAHMPESTAVLTFWM